MSVKTFPTVLDFLLNIEGFIIIYKNFYNFNVKDFY